MLQVDWPRAFLPITGESVFCLMWNWWWISITILVLILDYFQEKLMTKFFKKSENPILGSFGAFSAQIWAKMNFLEKRGLFTIFPTIYHGEKYVKRTDDPILRKMLKGQKDRQTYRQSFCRTLCRTGVHQWCARYGGMALWCRCHQQKNSYIIVT